MSYIGNRQGPRKSDIVQKLGPDYFGISPQKLDVEIDLYLEDEANGLVDPVCVGSQGRHFVVFNAPDGKTQKFYLEANGYFLKGAIQETRTEDRD